MDDGKSVQSQDQQNFSTPAPVSKDVIRMMGKTVWENFFFCKNSFQFFFFF